MDPTIIQDLGQFNNNHLFIKREDLIPFSFGGNKARKAELFFKEIDEGGYDSVVTYGSGSSNHCRIVANQCVRRGLDCYIIGAEETASATFNSRMMDLFGAEITVVPVNEVHDTIEGKIAELKEAGKNPFFIEGGGHGDTGTEAYVQCYDEIRDYELSSNTAFDYIFFASGTGTTQAGLVCGKLLKGGNADIIGISIARKNPRGRDIVIDSIRSYMKGRASEEEIEESAVFLDDFTSGYGQDDNRVRSTIRMVLKEYGIPLDPVYTGKAFMGMTEYIKKEELKDKNILFIHTGGTPLFFDGLKSI